MSWLIETEILLLVSTCPPHGLQTSSMINHKPGLNEKLSFPKVILLLSEAQSYKS